MPSPDDKDEEAEVQKRRDGWAKQLGPTVTKMRKDKKEGACPFCGELVTPESFRDELSRKEYKLSGLCQKCQDKTF